MFLAAQYLQEILIDQYRYLGICDKMTIDREARERERERATRARWTSSHLCMIDWRIEA